MKVHPQLFNFKNVFADTENGRFIKLLCSPAFTHLFLPWQPSRPASPRLHCTILQGYRNFRSS